MSHTCFFSKKWNAGDTNPLSDQIDENSNANHGNDNDPLDEIECCNSSEEEMHYILFSSDDKSDGESFCFV